MFSRIAKNARLGDGGVVLTHKNAHFSFTSTDLSVLEMKLKMCDDEGITYGKLGTQSSGYGGTKVIHKFSSRVHEMITEVYNADIYELINSIDKEDLFLWLIDDGSWHKNQRLFHLYCNMLNDEETNELIARINDIYGIAPTMRKDRKRDGREFNYLYFPRRLTMLVRPEFKKYLQSKGLESMFYKFGGLDYYDPIESLSKEAILSPNFRTISKVYGTARRFDDNVVFTEDATKVLITWNSTKGINKRSVNKEAV